jgi:transposase
MAREWRDVEELRGASGVQGRDVDVVGVAPQREEGERSETDAVGSMDAEGDNVERADVGSFGCTDCCSRRIRRVDARERSASSSRGEMIPHGVKVYVAVEPVDLRYSFDRLAGLVEERVGYDARSRALFVFFGRRKTGLKVLFFDGTGLCIFYKRLDRGTFRIPESEDAGKRAIEIDDATLEALLDGIEVERRRVH